MVQLCLILILKMYENSGNFQNITDSTDNKDNRDDNDNVIRHESIALEYLISRKYDRDNIEFDVWRQDPVTKEGKIVRLSTKCKVLPYMVPIHQFDESSSYYIFGGCVFIKLTQPYLHTWGEDWYHFAPRDLINESMKGSIPNLGNGGSGNGGNGDSIEEKEGELDGGGGIDGGDGNNNIDLRKEIIIMSNVLPTTVNMGSNRHCNVILKY